MSVTDLVAPRRAYWRAITLLPPVPERQHRLDAGRAIHRRFGQALAPEGALEVRVRRDGIVGRIDLLSDVPVELKTSASTVNPGELMEARPDHLEQLAMYVALADRVSGRLVTIRLREEEPDEVQAVDVEFGEAAPVRAEMRRRADALRLSWRERRPGDLPRCRWFGRGCEYEEAGACDCRGTEREDGLTSFARVGMLTPRPDIGDRIRERLRAVPPLKAPTVERFRDLLYLRRAYFERTSSIGPVEEAPRDPSAPADLYGRLREAIESGPLGEVERLPPRTEEPEEEVGGFRGIPFLLRTSRGWDRATADSLLARQPQYGVELGFRCVATGAERALLVLGRERAASDRDRVQAFEFQFGSPTLVARLWREREHRLAAAITARSPQELAPCPDWMYATCPYAAECACGSGPGRSQR